MQDDGENACERTGVQQRREEEERRRENEETQRREFGRKCEALGRKKAAAGGEDDAAGAMDGTSDGRTRHDDVEQVEEEEEAQQQSQSRKAVSRSEGDGQRSGKPRRRKNRRAGRQAETDAAAAAGRASPSRSRAKEEHPESRVVAPAGYVSHTLPTTKLIGTPFLCAQVTPPAPPLTPRGEVASHSEKSEASRQSEDSRTRAGAACLLFDPPPPAASAVPPAAVPESIQTREAAADVLFETRVTGVDERPRGSDAPAVAIVPIVKIGRASAAFYRNNGEAGNTRPPQKLSRGRGRGRGFGWHRRGGRAPRNEPFGQTRVGRGDDDTQSPRA